LFAFNVKIEAGQLLFVAAMLAVFEAARRMAGARPRWFELGSAYVMGSLAALWCVERTLALVFGL